MPNNRSTDRPYKHPGVVLKELYLEPLSITSQKLAKLLELDEDMVSNIISGQEEITTETALKLSRIFSTSPELWLKMQITHDIWYKSQSMDLNKYQPIN